jgi:hypothetical protein
VGHCPTPPLGTSQIPVSQVGADNVTITDATGGAGHRRGICVWLPVSQNTDMTRPPTVPNSIGNGAGTLQASLNADGWIFAYPAYPPDWSVNGGITTSVNISNDAQADAGHGSRWNTTAILWWDHMVNYLATTYGAGRPIIVGGFSLGAWAALAIAINRTSTIVGYIAHCPATIWSNITLGVSFGANTTGMDLSATALNAVTVPGIVGYSKTDGVVGWGLSTDSGYLGTPQANTNHMILNAVGASQPVTGYESSQDELTSYPNGHLLITADCNTFCTPSTGWVQTTLDPSYPVSF